MRTEVSKFIFPRTLSLFWYTNNRLFPAVSRWEWQPVNFQDPIAPQVLRIYQPSTPDIVAAIDTLNDYIAGIRDNKFVDIEKRLQLVAADSDKEVPVTAREMMYYQNQRRPIKLIESERDGYRRFLENREHYLGEVVAGSGVERSVRQIYAGEDHHDSIVDWALIRIAPHRSVDGNQASSMLFPLGRHFVSNDPDSLLTCVFHHLALRLRWKDAEAVFLVR